MWPASVKAKAIFLRKQNYSYGQLVKELRIPKSTLHVWIHGIKRPAHFQIEDRIRWAKIIQPMAVRANIEARKQRLMEIDNRICEEVNSYLFDKTSKKAILGMLYWAEGSKGRHDCVTLANTDPKLSFLFISLLRECFVLDEKKFRLRLHLHDYHDENVIKSYWSNLLTVPLNQFQKSYRKPRNTNKHFRENSYGVCFVRYNDVSLKDELLKLAIAISDKIAPTIIAPVVQRTE